MPIGYLFLSKPPVEQIPIPDLLDVIYLCQRRQAWYRDFARSVGEEPRGYVGSARLDSPVELVAAQMRRALDFDLDQRRECPTWTDALRRFIEQAEELVPLSAQPVGDDGGDDGLGWVGAVGWRGPADGGTGDEPSGDD